MTRKERLIFLNKELLSERPDARRFVLPESESDLFRLFRSLVNVREAAQVSEEFLAVQDEFLKTEAKSKGIVDISQMAEARPDIYLWQGDITRLKVGAIVNAANSGMTGCYYPCHGCIDNVIHTYAGVQLRIECDEIMRAQGFPEPTGKAKITDSYNLPCEKVIHTVGPIVSGRLTEEHCQLLKSCYLSCLEAADAEKLSSIAFCCISTGEFHFPNEAAAHIAIDTVTRYKEETGSSIKVIFNVFKDVDLEIYKGLL
ncbi:MAG: protein-ADP-ribose hydrolase [Oscillospiraceae bacterium]|nr:protein-ADP-ribose hydrolase [Oscillospiraceae bacterium]